MSYRSRLRRFSYIDRRLRYKRDYPSTRELAEGFAVEAGEELNPKTFQRDIEMMRDEMNAPIVYEPSRHGYFYEEENWELPAMHLTSGDLLALLVSDRALLSYRNSPFYDRVKSVFSKLTELLPEKVSVHSREIASNISIIPEPVTDITESVWHVVRTGLDEGRSISIDYRTPGYENSAKRRINPYHIIGQRGEWYLIGYTHKDEEVRIYAMARIMKCKLLNERFEHPGDFSPADYIDPGFGVFMKEEPVDIAIRFYPPIAQTITERYWHPSQQIEKLEDGSIILRFTSNQQTQTIYWVAKWGNRAEILEPAELRKKAAEWFAGAAERYGAEGAK
jgi:predicted DNA-binding transcriptional regulator YafY